MSNRGRGISVFTTLLLIAPCLYATEPWKGTYSYDGAGNITAIGPNHYYYDGAGRLVEAMAVTSAQSSVRRYSYDAFGNLNKVVTDGDAAHATIIGADPSNNRLTDSSNCIPGTNCIIGEYDTVGHQKLVGDAHVTYDPVDMMSTLDSGRHEFYVYDANDQRIAIVANPSAPTPSWRYTLRDMSAKVTREYSATSFTSSPIWTKDYVYRDGILLAAISDNTGAEARTHFHVDHLFTPRLITDDEGRRLAAHTYWAFGLEAAGSDVDSETKKYTGHERDFAGLGNTNDVDYMRARYYSPNEGRFLSIDSHVGTATKPISWNRYAYADDSAVNAFDPSGLLTGTVFYKPLDVSLGIGGFGIMTAYSENGDVSHAVTYKYGGGVGMEAGSTVGWVRARSSEELNEWGGAAEMSGEPVPGMGLGGGVIVSSKHATIGGQATLSLSAGPMSAFGGIEHVKVLSTSNVHDDIRTAKKLVNSAVDKTQKYVEKKFKQGVKAANDLWDAAATAASPGTTGADFLAYLMDQIKK